MRATAENTLSSLPDYLIEPPAATIFCSAEPETLSTATVSFTAMSPYPRP